MIGSSWGRRVSSRLEYGHFQIDAGSIDAKFVRILLTCNLLVEQASRRCALTEARHPINRVDSQTEAVSLVADRKFQGRIDIALFLVPADMELC